MSAALSPVLRCNCGAQFQAPIQALQDVGDGTLLGYASHNDGTCTSPAGTGTANWEICKACCAPIDGDLCTKCRVCFGHDPCGACGQRGYHAYGCAESDETIDAQAVAS